VPKGVKFFQWKILNRLKYLMPMADLSQRWFVFYYFKNPDTGKYERFREMISASFKTRSDRYAKGKELKDAMNKRLREGFNPFMDYYRAKHKPKSRTYNYAVIHMRTFFNLLVEREWILVNPFKKVKTLEVEETEIIAFTEDDLKKLRENLPGYNYDLFIIAGLIYYCFLRPAEIMRLQVYHFHIDEGYISVPANVSKNKRQNTIDIPENFIEDLKQLDLDHPPTHYVFARHLKRGIKEAAPTRIAGYWREFANEFDIDKNIYALKHTGNGRAAENGISVRDLQLHNRHSNLDMTQRYLDRFSKKVSTKVVKNFPKM